MVWICLLATEIETDYNMNKTKHTIENVYINVHVSCAYQNVMIMVTVQINIYTNELILHNK